VTVVYRRDAELAQRRAELKLTEIKMKTLLLLRHAKPENAVGAMSDFDRALNERGRDEAQAVGDYLQRRDVKLDLVVSSPAVRARETTEMVLEAAKVEVKARFDRQIYEAGWRELLALLRGLEEKASAVLLVGHNPALEDLVHMLVDRTEHMSPATLAQISLDAERWSTVTERTGTLDWIVRSTELSGDNR
jgi:phosphohistidine phosphatase